MSIVVPRRGLEPLHLSARPPQDRVSTIFTIWAGEFHHGVRARKGLHMAWFTHDLAGSPSGHRKAVACPATG